MTTPRKPIRGNVVTYRTKDGLEIEVESSLDGAPNRLTISVGEGSEAQLTREALQHVVNGWEWLTASAATAAGLVKGPAGQSRATRAVGGSGSTGERIVEAARIYSENIGQGPLMAVEREMHLSRSAASRLIRRAKDLGILES